jgi:uncharacterized protein YjiS (DUF1127 family)
MSTKHGFLAGFAHRPAFRLGDLMSVLFHFQERWRQRVQLAELDDRTLGDLGLTRADVLRESSKPFWRD